jgi:hypothetical protein
MTLKIDFDGLWDWGTKTRFESTLRECIGEAPGNEEWNVFVTSYGCYCVVLVKTPQHTRRKVFLLRALELVEAIPAWLKQYPLQ